MMIGTSYMPERKDMNDMGLVAMKICDDGIVAFADSKASRKDNNDTLFEDIDRGKIKKVFKNEHFIVVTSGNNEIIGDKGIQRIEDIMVEIMKSSTTIDEFLNEFQLKSKDDNREFNFMFGYKEDGDCFIQRGRVQDKSIHKLKKETNKTLLFFQGEKRYCDMLSQMNFHKYNTVQKAKKGIKQLMNYMIHLFNHYNEYNSVGLPINVEIFQ